MKIFLKCNEAAHLCDKSQYKEVDFWDKLTLKMHLVMCTVCRKHSKQNVKLTHTISSANIKTLCQEDKDRLKTKLEQEINHATKS